MGSNLAGHAGGPAENLVAAVERFASLGRIAARSSLYLTEPVGFSAQPKFVNAVAALETGLSPHTLLLSLLAIERDFGRDRAHQVANGPRTLDLDILMVSDFVLHEADLDLPHPRMTERAFVLVPLQEIASGLIEPRSRQPIAALVEQLRAANPASFQQVTPILNPAWDAAR